MWLHGSTLSTNAKLRLLTRLSRRVVGRFGSQRVCFCFRISVEQPTDFAPYVKRSLPPSEDIVSPRVGAPPLPPPQGHPDRAAATQIRRAFRRDALAALRAERESKGGTCQAQLGPGNVAAAVEGEPPHRCTTYGAAHAEQPRARDDTGYNGGDDEYDDVAERSVEWRDDERGAARHKEAVGVMTTDGGDSLMHVDGASLCGSDSSNAHAVASAISNANDSARTAVTAELATERAGTTADETLRANHAAPAIGETTCGTGWMHILPFSPPAPLPFPNQPLQQQQ